jgi:hypothetical protein
MRAFSCGTHELPTRAVQTSRMSMFWRALVVALLALPVGAYVAGGLTGSQADLPDQRPPVQVADPRQQPEPSTTITEGPSAPGGDDRSGDGDRDDDDGRGSGSDDSDDDSDDEVRIVRPELQDLDDDDDSDGDDDTDDDGDDDSDDD